MRILPRRGAEPEINLTPLIDVVFLLLIFFMVSTTFQRETEINVELPQAQGEPLATDQKVVEITIDAQGRYYVNRREVINTQIETLKRAIREAAEDDTQPRIILSADRRTPHHAVVTAMDASAQLGFFHLTFATARPEEGQ